MKRAAQEAEKTAARGRPATDPCNPSTREAGVGRNKFRVILVYTAKSCERWEGREDRGGGVAKLELKATLFKDPQISTASQGTDTDLSSKFIQENKKQKHKKLLMPRSETENDPQPSKRQSLTFILIIYKITDSHACAQEWQTQFLCAACRIGANAKLGQWLWGSVHVSSATPYQPPSCVHFLLNPDNGPFPVSAVCHFKNVP